MKEPNWKTCTEEDLWRYVATHLEKNGIRTILVGGAVVAIYSPTDCIRDRLASYIHFKARDCLDQAILVALNHPFNAKRVKEWCSQEGAPEAYEEFSRILKK